MDTCSRKKTECKCTKRHKCACIRYCGCYVDNPGDIILSGHILKDSRFSDSYHPPDSNTLRERLFQVALACADIEFEQHKQIDFLTGHRTKPDFIIGRLCIYVDGIHNDSTKKQKAKDKMQLKGLRKLGMKGLRYSDYDIDTNLPRCLYEIAKNLPRNYSKQLRMVAGNLFRHGFPSPYPNKKRRVTN
jgi:very-short-patch-repair endonuclease